jgi:hypothetical protein
MTSIEQMPTNTKDTMKDIQEIRSLCISIPLNEIHRFCFGVQLLPETTTRAAICHWRQSAIRITANGSQSSAFQI